MVQQQSALAEVVEQQRRHHPAIPCQLDRTPSEVPHVGIEGLGSGHAQHHSAQYHEGRSRPCQQEIQGVERVDGCQDGGRLGDFEYAEQCQYGEPEQHDGPEPASDPGGAVVLNAKQHHQHDQGDGEHEGRKLRGHDLQPLDGGEDGYRRSDHRIPDKEPHSGQPQQHHDGACAGGEAPSGEGGQGQYAPLPLVVSLQHQQHIFERHDEHDGPEEEGDYGIDLFFTRL
ncbi:hypothetical protein D3C76_912280 [compost metagenome]